MVFRVKNTEDRACPFCGKISKFYSHVQHVPRCPKNPNQKVSKGFSGLPAWNKGLSAKTDHRVAAYAATISRIRKENPVGFVSPEYFGSKAHRESASRGGGYRKGSGRGKRAYVCEPSGRRVCLQSSYEFRLYEILTELQVAWERPGPISYDNSKRYYPDFRLTEFDVYLDPKNDYLMKIDKAKIDKVRALGYTVFVLPQRLINKEYIEMLTKRLARMPSTIGSADDF